MEVNARVIYTCHHICANYNDYHILINHQLRLEAILNMGDENEDDEHGEHAKVWKSLSR